MSIAANEHFQCVVFQNGWQLLGPYIVLMGHNLPPAPLCSYSDFKRSHVSDLFRKFAEVLRKRGPERVARDLLVGFDPLSIYLAGLERRFDGVATFCADALGGPLIGVKWGLQVKHPKLLYCSRIQGCYLEVFKYEAVSKQAVRSPTPLLFGCFVTRASNLHRACSPSCLPIG